ncbi:transporter substrate-binding domain-containing protein [Desulfovibrio sulfodismutans]|uniref:histidine kinase n=1 Tax=Desulfolutivibrio sulfodismutans TaxID=63561 RepID=A0A7K3NL06_9BACT|nr:transporter substrate-binding domain-containing protein [Desulfolutivibrio sulfodismutans]NDY56513.1 transporter substrate-binding domain-containing protein [Desulfolutivibrio sulfodismutans]QLA12603.1 transporter substrate-binding domain-containing protein [Desulfolutivibrio sulfodismutans DSM 3696]
MKTRVALMYVFVVVLWAGLADAQKLNLTPEEQAFVAAHPVVTWSDADRPPLSIMEKGRSDGILHDYYRQMAGLTGMEFRFTPIGDGKDIQPVFDALKKKGIDMVGGSGIIPGQAAFALFSGPLFHVPMGLACLATSQAKSLEELSGRPVAVVRGSLAAEFAREGHPGMDLLVADTPRQAVDMAATGKAAAMLGDMAGLTRTIREMGRDDIRVLSLPEHSFEVYALIREDWPLLASILAKAQAALPPEAMHAMEDDWLRPDVSASGAARLNLTAEERRYIRDNPVFTASNESNWPPFNFNVNGLPQGYSVDYMNMLARMAGLKVRYVIGPEWDEFEHRLQGGTLDVLMNMASTPEREAYTDFTPPYATLVHGIASREGKGPPPTLESLAGRTVAVSKGFFTEKVLAANYPDIRLKALPDALSCLQAVATGETDAAIDSLPVQNYLIRKHFLLNLQTRALVDNRHFPTVNIRFGVSKNKPVLARILAKAMATVGERQMSELRQKWLAADRMDKEYIPLTPSEQEMLSRLGAVRLCVHPNWMPFGRIDEQGNFEGMAADYVRLMAERIGVDLKLVPTKTWEQSLEGLAEGLCDIIPAIPPTDERRRSMSFTRPYLTFPVVAATLTDTMFVPDMASLAGKRIGAVAGQAWIEDALRDYPEVEVVRAPSVEDGLRMLQSGEIFAFVDTLAAISYAIGQGRFADIKIAGKLEGDLSLAVGVSQQNPDLTQVFDMAVASLTENERRDIFSRWISITFEHGFDYELFWKILAGLAVAVAAIVFWNRKLVRLNRAVTLASDNLGRAHAKISTLLDNSGQGFLSFAADGLVEPELSRECDRLFGKPAAGSPIPALLYPADAKAGEVFGHNVRRILAQEDAFKRDLLLTLMPRHFVLGDTQVDAQYRFLEGGRIMLVLTDVTDKCALEAEVERERKRLAMIVAAARDRDDFMSVLADYERFARTRVRGEPPRAPGGPDGPDGTDDVGDMDDGDGGYGLPTLYRHVHTFKGLFLQLEFIHSPQALHRLETALAARLAAGERRWDQARLRAAWEESGCGSALDDDLGIIRAALGEAFFEQARHVPVSVDLVERLEGLAVRLAARAGEIGLTAGDGVLLQEVRRLRERDLRHMLAAYPESARKLAERTGKIVQPFAVEGDAVRVPPKTYAPFVSALVHVFRNAVVHGIEEPEIRLDASKPEAGRLACRVTDLGDRVRIVVEDDGRGIGVQAVQDKAREMGVSATGDTLQDLNLVFERGMTTQKASDVLSGRGVGLFAVREQLTRLGGTVQVVSVPGQGTTFTFTLPKQRPSAEAAA